MTVSPIKTQVVGTLAVDEWIIEDYVTNVESLLKSVVSNSYLGS